MVVVGVWAAGRVVRACGTALSDSARAAWDEATRQRTELRDALETDRAHVARELHDAVGHAMTTVVMLATAAVRVWDSEPRLAAEHCTALRATLAEALDELGPLLESVAGRGARDLSAVPALIERARASGQRLSLRIDAPAVVDPDDGAVVYRLVQEALTNAARHAPGAAVDVYIGCSGGELTVRVANDCAGPPAADGGGQGLRGMAERATSRGGTLRAGPVADGFLVEAVMPARAAG
jgi:signal transduction histidine kinase